MLVAERRVDLKKLASATFPLAEINRAFDHAASGEGLKTVITSE